MTRHTRLDGWRALAVLGVMWHHWTPAEWRGAFPFEIGLFYFLTLTGFLITRILLRERQADEGISRGVAYGRFLKRRITRVLLPCYVAMGCAWAAGAPDIVVHPWAYFGQWANFHMAFLHEWPWGTAPFWTLALQVQFYVFWPWVIFLTPARWLGWVLSGLALLAPLTRWALLHHFPEVIHGGVLPPAALDYIGVGALLAWGLAQGWKPEGRRWKWAGGLAFTGYAVLYAFDAGGDPVPGIRHFQQTLVSIVFATAIAGSLADSKGRLGRFLDHPALQHIGRISFGLYLFHEVVPLLLGYAMPFLWKSPEGMSLLPLRLVAFALASWGVAWLSWRYLERGRVRQAP